MTADITPTVPRRLLTGDDPPATGEWVQIRCPICTWQSPESLVIARVNGAWHAYQAVQGEWSHHWDSAHRRTPERWVVPEPNGSSAGDDA